jgi:hypothetical protein
MMQEHRLLALHLVTDKLSQGQTLVTTLCQLSSGSKLQNTGKPASM